MKSNVIFTVITILAIGIATACSKPANDNASAPASSNSNAATPKPSATPSEAATPAAAKPEEANKPAEPAASKSAPTTPEETYKAFYAARRSKDVATMKKLVAKEMYEFFEILGEGKPNPVEAGLLEICSQPTGSSDAIRNVKVSGDKATMQILDGSDKWITMDMVKEDGAWKLTIERMGK